MFISSEKPKRVVLLPTVLTLFDGAAAFNGAAAGAAAGAGTGAATSAGTTGGSGQKQTPGPGQTGKSSDKTIVVYGKEDPDTAANVQTTPGQKDGQTAAKSTEETSPFANLSPEEKEKAYYKLVRGEFKDLFANHTQKIIDERFKNTKQLEARLNESQPVLDLLMSKFGAKSITELNAKLEEEILPELAEQAGMTPAALKRQLELEQENKRLKREQQEKSANERVDKWFHEATAMTGTPDKPGKYPDFNLKASAEHPKYGPQFVKLLESGISVEAAYLAAFHEELIGKAQAATAKAAESATLEAIKSGGMRPQELGAKPQSGITRKASVTELSKEDRAEIARRAARGEKIKF